jgi:putative MATE family efflux protein
LKLSPIDRRIVRLGVPALGTLAVEPLYRLVDTAIVGRIGTDELSGVAIAVTVLTLVVSGSNFLTYGTTERVASRIGAGRMVEAADVGVQTMWLSAAVGLIMTPLLFALAPMLTAVLGAEGDVHHFAVQYLRIALLGIPFVLIALGAQGVQRGGSDYRTPLVILLASNLMNLVLILVLVYGFDLGVAGAAWSTVIAQAAAGAAFLVVIRARLAPAAVRRPDWAAMRPLLTAGRYLLLRVGSILAVFTGATALVARIDSPSLAAHQIAVTMFAFLALTLDALAVPAQTLVAEELGRPDGDSADIARRVVRMSAIAGAIIAALLAVLSPVLPHVFTDDPAVVSRATAALLYLALLLLPGSVAFAFDGVLIGAADYRFLGRAALAYLIAVLPIGVAVMVVPSAGLAGIWIGLVVWMLLRAVFNLRRVRIVLTPL